MSRRNSALSFFLALIFIFSQSFFGFIANAESNDAKELTADNGITHVPNERGFTTFVDRDKLPESIRSFVKISVSSSDMPINITTDNIRDFGGFSTYDDQGFNSGLPSPGKYYNLTILYDKDNNPLAYYPSKVEYKGNTGDSPSSGVSKIILSEEDLAIRTGKTAKIRVYFENENGEEKDITNDSKTVYRSSSTSTVTVNKGIIRASNKVGKAVITVSYKGKKADLPVSVTKTGIENLTASVKELNVSAGESKDIEIYAHFSDKKVKNVTELSTWLTDNSEAISVDSGEVEGISDGEGTVTAIYEGNEISIPVTVSSNVDEKSVESLQIQDKNIKMLVNEEGTIKVDAIFDDGSREDYTDQVQWRSSKSSVVDVQDGIITANKLGMATITVSFNDVEASVKVEVTKDKKIKKLSASTTKVNLKRGQDLELKFTAYYIDGTKRDVTDLVDWKTTKSDVVAVEDGVITAKNKKGSTIVTGSYNGASVKITVTVK